MQKRRQSQPILELKLAGGKNNHLIGGGTMLKKLILSAVLGTALVAAGAYGPRILERFRFVDCAIR